jgi:hypothetical protein
VGVQEDKGKRKWEDSLFKEIMAENFPILEKERNI